MAEPGKVVDLRTRSTYQPDFATLARHRLHMARKELGQTYDDFAAMLTPLVGWPVSAAAVEAWETSTVPPGDVLVAVSTVTPTASDKLGIRSHKFIAAYIGVDAARLLIAAEATGPADAAEWMVCHSIPVDHPTGECRLHLWPFGVAIFHLVEDLDLPNIASLAIWRSCSYEENLDWATHRIRALTANDLLTASYVLSLYWLHTSIWAGRMLDTALRIICSPRVLLDRNTADVEVCRGAAEQAERSLLAEGFEHNEMHRFGLAGVSLGYASWSGVAYHPLDSARALTEHELVSCELATQAVWAYCEHINQQVEVGGEPFVPDEYGWRFLRGARSRLANPRPQESGQHRSMRDAIVNTSGLVGHLEQAIDALRETNER